VKHPLLISAHMDGEVEAPWASELDRLLQERPEWQALADQHRAVKERLASSPEPDVAASQEVVWSRLQASVPSDSTTPAPLRFWLTLPAVAAALLVVLATGYWWGSTSTPSGSALAELEVLVPTEYDLRVSGDGLLVPATFEGGSP